MNTSRFKRVLLKISGESLMGVGSYGIDVSTVDRVAKEISQVCKLGIEICLVIGAGNIFRGLSGAAAGMDRASADYMGMLATVMNSLAMQNSLERLGLQTRIQSAISMTEVCETYTRRRAIRHMEKNRIVIFAAGTGNPIQNQSAIKFDKITYGEVLAKNLRVLDSSAVSLARENNIPIIVFSINENNGFLNIIQDKGNCSIVEN